MMMFAAVMLLIPPNSQVEKNHVRAIIRVKAWTVNAELSYMESGLLRWLIMAKIGRNELCPCSSDLKYKRLSRAL
jgi:hypothetical protein